MLSDSQFHKHKMEQGNNQIKYYAIIQIKDCFDIE